MAEFDLNGPAAIVQDKYQRSINLADQAARSADSMQAALNAGIYTPATISVHWGTIAAPSLPQVPDLPSLPPVGITTPGDMPSALDLASLPDVEVVGFELQPPAMDFGQAPELVIGQAPALPQMREVTIPDAPDVQLPDAPEFLSLTTHSFGGVDLHEDWLSRLDQVPELQLLEPAPFEFKRAPGYASGLLGNLKAMIASRIQGGTGLKPEAEQAIWDRSRDRETQVALAREQEVMRSRGAGFSAAVRGAGRPAGRCPARVARQALGPVARHCHQASRTGAAKRQGCDPVGAAAGVHLAGGRLQDRDAGVRGGKSRC